MRHEGYVKKTNPDDIVITKHPEHVDYSGSVVREECYQIVCGPFEPYMMIPAPAAICRKEENHPHHTLDSGSETLVCSGYIRKDTP